MIVNNIHRAMHNTIYEHIYEQGKTPQFIIPAIDIKNQIERGEIEIEQTIQLLLWRSFEEDK